MSMRPRVTLDRRDAEAHLVFSKPHFSKEAMSGGTAGPDRGRLDAAAPQPHVRSDRSVRARGLTVARRSPVGPSCLTSGLSFQLSAFSSQLSALGFPLPDSLFPLPASVRTVGLRLRMLHA